jgi:cyclopropane-fatty-acyl-phospholipid synthase
MSSKKICESILEKADVEINGSRDFDINVKNSNFYRRVLAKGSMGLGESYMDGWWDADSLDEFFNKVLKAKLAKKIVSFSLIMNVLKAMFFNMQNKKRSHKVAKEHYDVGNDLYEKMLGKRMQYTCAYWNGTDSLEQAQENKLEMICKKINLRKEDTVLELGCGWGGFAKYAAEKYSCSVTGYNISEEQVKYARESCKGLPVEIIKDDYRNATGKFDKVVSVGLCEHVGSKNYRNLMKLAHSRLKDDGVFLLHTIGRNTSSRITDPWIDKYIFPGGMIPSIKQLSSAFEGLFVVEDLHNFGPDYDKTLMAWFKNFDESWDKIKSNYSERFYRMWKYYLLSCAGYFRSREGQLWQFVLSKQGIPGGHKSIR